MATCQLFTVVSFTGFCLLLEDLLLCSNIKNVPTKNVKDMPILHQFYNLLQAPINFKTVRSWSGMHMSYKYAMSTNTWRNFSVCLALFCLPTFVVFEQVIQFELASYMLRCSGNSLVIRRIHMLHIHFSCMLPFL